MEEPLSILQNRGVNIIDPRQTYIAPEVDLSRILSGSTLYPGVRLTGQNTFIGENAKIGTEGPATIHNSTIGNHAEVASGFITDSTLLPRAKAGANAHFRAGTLLEEEASTAHAVGLKQTILMYGVTLGSLINLCDALLSGGRSRTEHTEVGSGFIHFNFTPWGPHGDKATPSLFGDVTHGVFLDQNPIFLGGLSGAVGPVKVGFGAMTIAGQTIRHDVPDATMTAETISPINKPFDKSTTRPSERHIANKLQHNIDYILQLFALKNWYQLVRIKRSELQHDSSLTLIYQSAINTIDSCIAERFKRYNDFAKTWDTPVLDTANFIKSSSDTNLDSINWRPELPYDDWVRQLSSTEKQALISGVLEKICYNQTGGALPAHH